MKKLNALFLFLILSSSISFAQQNECPRIYKVNDTLKTDPAASYQWYKDGIILPNANNIWYRPTESGNYTVAVGGISFAKKFIVTKSDLEVAVFDRKLQPVVNATITVDGQTTTTNSVGMAFLPNVVSGRTVVKASAEGYFNGFSSVYKPDTGKAIVKIQLQPMPEPLTVKASTGGMVGTSTGLAINFKPNSFIVESTGEPYNGEVSVYVSHRAPENDPLFAFAMPGGDFTALDANGETVALTSYGFFSAELKSQTGEALNLKPGAPADVQFRIPEDMRNDAAATIPLWYFDEAAGIWKYDDLLTRTGIFYKGKVAHFSSWNCDYMGPRCIVKASATDCAGNPAPYATICLNQYCRHTDANGNITFMNAPADLPLTLSSNIASINIGIVGDGNTYTLTEPILTSNSILAYVEYWQDTIVINTWNTAGQVSYSLDGTNWQNENLFTGVPFQDSVTVWIKDTASCPIKQIVPYMRNREPLSCASPLTNNQISLYSAAFSNVHNYTLPMLYSVWNGGQSPNCTDGQFSYAVKKHPCIVKIVATNGSITQVPPEIGNLSALKTLLLKSNSQLVNIPAEIGNLFSLQDFELTFNDNLSSLPEEIGNLTQLYKLLLNDNKLTSLPESIGYLTNLIDIKLYNNQLTSLPASFGNLINLTELEAYNNQLITLPPSIGNLVNLTGISLYYNKLLSIPAEIGNLTKLKKLSLYENQLSSLPPQISNLNKLELLYLNNNQLSSLPPQIGNLSKLKTLYLYNNKLTSLPESIGNLNELVTLNLDANLLTHLPSSIGNLSMLKILSLNGNKLNSFAVSLINLSQLEHLNLSENQISNLPVEVGAFPALKSLALANNQLTALPASIGNLKSTLQILYLQGNPIPVQDRPYYQSLLPNTQIFW